MGKQLIILLTLIIGGAPSNVSKDQSSKSKSEELAIAGFDCLSSVFEVLQDPAAEDTIFHEIGTATVVDQTVYVLLEGIVDDKSDDLCLAAAKALQALYLRVTDRVVLASIMPRTVSALAKVLKPTTQVRRSYRLLSICLQVLGKMLKTVLNNRAAGSPPEERPQPQGANERLALDESWLRATATQIKLALANVIRVRRHDRPEVQTALLDLCLVVIEDCQATLADSVPLMVETVIVLSEFDEYQTPNNAYSTLKYLATTYPVVLDSLKDSLHTWTTSFPRTMQSNDETAKQWGIKQISTVFQVLSQVQSGSDILADSLASGLCDSVAIAVNTSATSVQLLGPSAADHLNMEVLQQSLKSPTFPSVLLDHRSQHQTLQDLQSMVTKLNYSESGTEITRSIMNRVHHASGNSIIAPLWLALTFLKMTPQATAGFDDFISLDSVEWSLSSPTRAAMIEELYYTSLPVLSETLTDSARDWRVLALALEAVTLQAQQLGEGFRPELIDTLYPVLQMLASSNPSLQKHAMTCLNILTSTCNYADTSSMIVENVDYLVNSVSLKLNTFDISPYPPQVLFMMVKLCGARLIPYLDDLIGSIFGILDMYHGYPKLVEIMFKTLAAIVEEGTKKPSLLAIDGGQENKTDTHRKRGYERLPISTLAADLASRKARRAKHFQEIESAGDIESHPTRPWGVASERTEALDPNKDSLSDLMGEEESDEPLPPPKEPEDAEKPLGKSHELLLHIVKSIPPHLSSPSPYLRRSLLSILIQAFPVLAQNENSFLPLVNEIWPSVVSKIVFPSSFRPDSSSTTLMAGHGRTTSDDRSAQGPDELEFEEETYVVTTACQTVEIMCQTAGDFMASRIEVEFPRWERFYRRAWDKVCQDAEKVIERRSQKQQQSTALPTHTPTPKSSKAGPDLEQFLALGISQQLSLTTAGFSTGGHRSFTPHHTIWRSLTSLFITLLTHVRLPLATGDQICEFLGAWIARFAGPDYNSSLNTQSAESLAVEIKPVKDAIQAMETWNADLSWFIFQQQRTRVLDIMEQGSSSKAGHGTREAYSQRDHAKPLSLPGGRAMFADMVF